MSTNTHSPTSAQPFSAELIFTGPETLTVRPAGGVNGSRQPAPLPRRFAPLPPSRGRGGGDGAAQAPQAKAVRPEVVEHQLQPRTSPPRRGPNPDPDDPACEVAWCFPGICPQIWISLESQWRKSHPPCRLKRVIGGGPVRTLRPEAKTQPSSNVAGRLAHPSEMGWTKGCCS